MIGIVTSAFVGAFFTHVGTDPGELRTVTRITGYEPGVKRREIDDIPTEPNTPLHLLPLVDTCIAAPLTDLGCLLATLDTVALLVAQVVDLGNGFCKSHYVSFNDDG